MAYSLQAIILNSQTARDCWRGSPVVELPQDKSMIPLVDKLLDRYGIPFLAFTDDGMKKIPKTLAKICLELSANSKVAYIECNNCFGKGSQANILWQNGKFFRGLTVQDNAINIALEFMGVEKRLSHDLFDELGLGQCRSTNAWLKDNEV